MRMRWSDAWDHVARNHPRMLLLIGFPFFPLLLLMLATWDEGDILG